MAATNIPMNMFGNQSNFTALPLVDLQKCFNLFGTSTTSDQSQSLWGISNPVESNRKGKIGLKNKKEQQRVR
jgi:hypothetical protein